MYYTLNPCEDDMLEERLMLEQQEREYYNELLKEQEEQYWYDRAYCEVIELLCVKCCYGNPQKTYMCDNCLNNNIDWLMSGSFKVSDFLKM